jgi:hypothetical protein
MNEKEGEDVMSRGSVLLPRVLYTKIRGRLICPIVQGVGTTTSKNRFGLAKSNPQALNGDSFYLHYVIKPN